MSLQMLGAVTDNNDDLCIGDQVAYSQSMVENAEYQRNQLVPG